MTIHDDVMHRNGESRNSRKEFLNASEEIIEIVKNKLEEKYAHNIPRFYLSQLRAIENWLERYTLPYESSNHGQVKGYLESLHHICELKNIEAAKLNLCLPIRINVLTDVTIPLKDYLLYKGLVAELFPVLEKMGSFAAGSKDEDFDILLLKGKVWSWFGSLGKANFFLKKQFLNHL